MNILYFTKKHLNQTIIKLFKNKIFQNYTIIFLLQKNIDKI